MTYKERIESLWNNVYNSFKAKRISVWRETASPWFTGKIDFLKHKGVRTVLDAGCGDGRNLIPFAESFNVTGIDVSDSGLRKCRANCKGLKNVVLKKELLEVLDFEVASFDAIICDFVMEHLENAEKVVDRFFHVLKKDGYLLLEFKDSRDPQHGTGKRIGKEVYLQKRVYVKYYSIPDTELLLRGFRILCIDSAYYTDPHHGSGYHRKTRHTHHSLFVLAQKNEISPNVQTPTEELAKTLQKVYSVTGKELVRKLYPRQMKQYPLYPEWFNRIEECITNANGPISVLEYGPGPGLLAERIVRNPNVRKYTAVEPDEIFHQMTEESILKDNIKKEAKVNLSKAEDHIEPESADMIVHTAVYHHFDNKPKALRNNFINLRKGGDLIMGEVFIPNYAFDETHNPVNRHKFTESVLRWAAAQILAMPNPSETEIIDQIKTAFLDILQIEEMKNCVPILRKQLEQTGFKDIHIELMKGHDPGIDYETLGWYFITAKKP